MGQQSFLECEFGLFYENIFGFCVFIMHVLAHALQAVDLVSECHLLQRATQHLSKGFQIRRAI